MIRVTLELTDGSTRKIKLADDNAATLLHNLEMGLYKPNGFIRFDEERNGAPVIDPKKRAARKQPDATTYVAIRHIVGIVWEEL